MITTTHARQLEREGKWPEALKVWKDLQRISVGKPYQSDIDAIELIISSGERGDHYRALVDAEDLDGRLERREITKYQHSARLSEIYNSVFRSELA